MKIPGRAWKPAASWWGAGLAREPLEIDVVAESIDGKSILLGEAEWTSHPDFRRLTCELERKASNFPDRRGRQIFKALWTTQTRKLPDVAVIGPGEVLEAMK
jgi:hypothetical protein